jgi:DNA invertase Pin-like site-specific DNA recombinase
MAEKKLRCAIYTRKSTEDGLQQEFNSLDAQYEACAAYALSQQHEGWVVLRDRYDDGGFSGGNMERPGLKRLLTDIKAGKIDIVLLYKIDRLTRSLTDFSKIVEVMDRAGASFVSITQSFNTTTSMGRLTLNMLLSFAQFEREVTGERIRDKIAASKKKGMWMGGPVPLGYEVRDRKLVVKPDEADQVRHIMQRYLVLGSVPALAEELNEQGYRTKVQKRSSGPHRGGCIYRRGTLYHLLSNRIYCGMIVHKGKAYPGEHQPIVDEKLWHKVQAMLKSNACGSSRRKRNQNPSLLVGKVFDGDGRAMTPSHAQRGKKRYRYYVTRPDEVDGSPAWRVNAHDLERLVCEQLAKQLDPERIIHGVVEGCDQDARDVVRLRERATDIQTILQSGKAHQKADLLERIVGKIDLGREQVTIMLDDAGLARELSLQSGDLADDLLQLVIPAVKVRRGHQLRLIIPGPDQALAQVPRRDLKLIALLAEAIAARDLLEEQPDQSIAGIAAQQGRCRTRLGKLVQLACLDPEIIKAIVEGRQPETLDAKRFASTQLPLAWEEQRRLLGFA